MWVSPCTYFYPSISRRHLTFHQQILDVDALWEWEPHVNKQVRHLNQRGGQSTRKRRQGSHDINRKVGGIEILILEFYGWELELAIEIASILSGTFQAQMYKMLMMVYRFQLFTALPNSVLSANVLFNGTYFYRSHIAIVGISFQFSFLRPLLWKKLLFPV